MEERIYRPGERVGTYEVISHLATGGDAALYVAKNVAPEAERREPVAIKACRFDPRTMSRDAVARFNDRLNREYKLLEPLWHRNIARVFERQTHEGVVFYALEQVEGPTLGRWRAEKPRTFQELMLVYRQLAGALAYAHRRALVHRDVKPSNVLIHGPRTRPADGVDWGEPSDPEDAEVLPFLGRARVQAVLIDFNAAQALTAAPLTAPGTLVGTAEFLAPEYARVALERSEKPYRARPREDVYQMGVLLYMLLTGRHPVRTPAGQFIRLLEEIAFETPPAPREVNPEAPEALSTLCMACLAKDSRTRPQDGAELLRRLVPALREDASQLATLAPMPEETQDTALVERTEEHVPVTEIEKTVERDTGGIQQKSRAVLLGAAALFCVALGMVIALGVVAWSLARSMQQVTEYATREGGRGAKPSASTDTPRVNNAVMKGLPMPEKPDPRWLKCPKDCGYGNLPACTWQGQKQIRSFVGFRGTCWNTFKNTPPKAGSSHESKCQSPNAVPFYDPPPDAPSELARLCFIPLADDEGLPNAVEPQPRP